MAGTELAKAYVQIIPSAQGIQGKITSAISGEASSAGNQAGNTLGQNLVSTFKTAIVSLGIGSAIKEAFTEGANLQQSLGGIETLFKENADTVKQYAAEAYKTAGLSANEYMESVTSFSASLLQSLGGDTAMAAEVANMALVDMSDNANKMGTSMELIQNAYQGFAKQNYTMLDNLKLGYGGTKTEMERLLADAQALSGVDYSIDNLNDVYEAIHVIQGEMEISGRTAEEVAEIYKNTGREVSEQLGTTAKEGATTFSGALASMKAAATNLLGKLTLGQDTRKELYALQETFKTFFFDNLIPMFGNVLSNLPSLIDGILTMVIQSINKIAYNSDGIIQVGINLVTELADCIVYNIPYLVEAAWYLISEFGRVLIETDWVAVASNLMSKLQGSMELAAAEILGSNNSIISAFAQSIQTNLPRILEKGIEIVSNLVSGILQNIPQLLLTAGELISQFIAYVMLNLPTILEAGVQLLLSLVNGILDPQSISAIIDSVIQVIAQFAETVLVNLPQILESGIQIIAELAAGIIEAIPKVVAVIPQVFQSIKNEFGNKDWLSIGSNIIEGIKNGILNGISKIAEAAKKVAQEALEAAKNALGINSPSKEFLRIGEFVTMGFAQGITQNATMVSNALKKISQENIDGFKADVAVANNMAHGITGVDNSLGTRMDVLIALLYQYLPECAKPTTIDGESIVDALNRELGMAVI